MISAIRYAHRRGLVLVAAAGNAEDTRVAYPALARNVIAVGATTEHGCLAEYSNTGQGLDLVAPGGGADAALAGEPACRPYEQAGRDIFQYTFSGVSLKRFGLPFGYEGTSMSVPHVSGTIALMLGTGVIGQRAPISPAAIEQRLSATARDLGPPGYVMSIPRFPVFEAVVEKAVELGVASIHPFLFGLQLHPQTRRSVSRKSARGLKRSWSAPLSNRAAAT